MIRDAHYRVGTASAPAVAWAAIPRPVVLLAVLLALWLAACASSPPPRPAARVVPGPDLRVVDVAPSDPVRANNVLMRALGLVGTPYLWGGNTPESGFDCSGLVVYVFRDAAGLALPRSTREIDALRATQPPRQRLAPGDLVLFGNGKGANHVGIYVGEGRFVHAPNEGGTVRLDRLDGHYWRDSYRGAKRVLD